MKKTKFLALILCLSFLCTLLLPATAYADDLPVGSGMKYSKTATANKDGSYTITLEAFATGSQTTSTQTEDVPTDIILVLDQSGSMADNIGQVKYTAYTGNNTQNKSNYEKRHNGGSANLWHKLPDGSFVSVSVTKTPTYNELSTTLPNYKRNSECYWKYANNLYEKVGDEYKNVTVDYYWNVRKSTYTYTYTFSSDNRTIQSDGNDSVPVFGNRGPLYTPDTVYTYTYTDSAGVLQAIGTSSIGANTRFTPAFYQRSVSTSGGGSRLNALKSAANAFTNAVAAKAAGADGDINTTADNINHRIAVVGYADTDPDYGYNTGVFIGSTLNRYGSAAAGVYGTALQDMRTTGGKNNVTASLNALQASGATRTDYGLTMANGILNANPVPTGETRNRVVIVFTDGSPTNSNGFERAVANSAISTANAIKAGETTVYSIGIFSGADASTAGKEPDKDYYDDFWGSNYTDAEMSAACNWFMQKVSSNNGTPNYPSYYLSAGDAASLNNIFQQISNNITTGGTTSTLTSDAVVKDIISPQFTLPEGATASSITLETYCCTGKNGSDYTWSKNADAMGAKASISGDQVNVTGFNFSENYVGTVTENGSISYRGNKLVISFKVEPKAGFLGGNDVPTNASAGIYENASAQTPVITFERPTVNVPIQNVTVTAEDKNVYLLGEVTADQLKTGATVKVGDVTLDLSKATDIDKPYGLDPWQTEYVDITVAVKDKDGKVISDKLDNLTDDTTYTVEVIVAPKNEGTSTAEKGDAATAKTGGNDPAANIYVFKPEVTFKDSEAYYGAVAPTYTDNPTNTEWKHTTATGDILGTAPKLDITYTPEAGKIADNKINTKQDFGVDVTVKIDDTDVTDKTTFLHTACTGQTCTLPEGKEFLIHVKTCTLTITKTDGKDGEPYVFTVKKDGQPYTEVTIVGNGTETIVELPVGKYTIQENSAWSWRYNADNGSEAALSAANPNDSITCINSSNGKIYWLNGFSPVVKNIFSISH